MKLGIMQPYFVPYAGYFELIQRCDKWIVFDTAQYIRHGWVNRNRILHPTNGWQYWGVPIKKHSRDTPIQDICISTNTDWRERLLGQLNHYRGKAPFYPEVIRLVSEALQPSFESLGQLNVHLLEQCCQYLGITFNYQIFSAMELTLPPITCPGDWALEISDALGANEYLNPPGGEAIFSPSVFESRGIKLTLQKSRPFIYPTPSFQFVPDLSIIDAMMWCSAEVILKHLVEVPESS